MAEFKLGRLRFVWQGPWVTSYNYVKDDIVSYGSKTYVCLVGHTSNAVFYTDLGTTYWAQMSDGVSWLGSWSAATSFYKLNDIVQVSGKDYICITAHAPTQTSPANQGFYTDLSATKWQLVLDGISWKSTWATSTYYYIGDVIKFGAKEYICIQGHTSSNTTNSGFYSDLTGANWQLFVDGQTWQGAWTASTYYKIGDVVNYGATTYICIGGHTSGSTLEAGQANWQTFSQGFNWTGTYANPYTYKLNDIAKFGADVYICTTAYTSSTSTLDLTKWSLFVSGLEFMNSYSSGTSYALGDVVTYGGYVYQSVVTNNQGNTPSTSTGNWSLITTGFSVQGAWSILTSYKVGNVVTYGSYVYVATLDSTGNNPSSSPTYWSLLNTGLSWQGLWTDGGSFTAYISNTTLTVSVVGSTYLTTGQVISGNGTLANTVITGQVSGTTGGTGVYSVNLSQTVGASGAGQVSLTATTLFKLGDAVSFGANSYICIKAHTAGFTSVSGPATLTNNRPDVDTTAIYWNALASGSASSVLTTLGDTLYYSASGNARLPIGADGQILRVTGNIPTWNYFGQVSNVFYVAPSGTDATDYGITLDKPWKTVAYACTRIAQGPANPNAQFLIKANRTFVGNEANNYLAYTNKASITGTTAGGAFTTTNTSGLAANMPIVFNTFGGYITTITQSYASQNLSVISSSGTLLTVGSTISGVNVNQPLTFSVGFGNVSSGTTYYVQSVSGTQFTISLAPGGSVYTVGSGGAGTAAIQGTFVTASTVGLTLNVPLTVSGTLGGLSTSTTYYVANIINSTLITLSTSNTGSPVITGVTATSGSMTLTTTNTLTVSGSALTTSAATVTATYAAQSFTINSSLGTVITTASSMSGVQVNQPITFAASFGNVVAGATYYVLSASGTSLSISLGVNGTVFNVGTGSTSTTATVQSVLLAGVTTNLIAGSSFTFSGTTFGGVNTTTTYYVTRVLSTTLFQISTTNGGPSVTTITGATGTMTVNQGITYYVNAITTNTSFTVSLTYNGSAATAAGSGTVTSVLSYNGFKTVRDIGEVLDAGIYDLGRGGNLETTLITKLYYATETTYISTATQYLLPYFISALNYASTLTSTNVLGNSAPANNYQTLNGISSSVSQTINGSYTAESGTATKVTSLFAIVTSGLNAGTTAYINPPINPMVTLYVKTGTYSEILPISVPAFTAIVGDELRTTVIQPYTFSVTAVSSSGASLVLSDASAVTVGMGISGNVYLPDGAYVIAKSSNTLTLNVSTTGNVTGALVAGYTVSNMFYMRNGTGARNMSVTGLFGTMTAANAYGTKRPTAGAYFSLDPGAGPDDDTVWIYSRSPYIQNVSLFGTGCVGAKIDGGLHNGGNKSMTLNDFTNILSDGIAVWATNISRVEAVSVFSYYAYAGYLSEYGGAIRATNGNSSYGTYGVVAEGSSPAETAITAVVNTQTQQAQVSYVLTSGSQILWLEYSNAGQTYSSASYGITSGSGTGAVVSGANYFTNAVTEVRVISGGAGYVTATNVAQTGTNTSITISAADLALTPAYNGERIVLIAGTGAGQYGFVNYYNPSTKQAIVVKESVVPLTISSCTASVYNVSSTSTLSVGTPVVFTGTTFGGVSINTVYYVASLNFTATTFSVATASGGAPAFPTGSGSGTMSIYVAGWDVAVSGTPVQSALDGSTRYIIEPRVTFSGSGTGAFARAVVTNNQVSAIRIINPGTGYGSAPSITLTDPNATSAATFTVRVAAAGVLGQPSWSSRGTSYSDATITITGNGYADFQAVGFFINLSNITALPVAGSNIVFAGNSNYYIVVQVLSYSGSVGAYNAYVQINPGLTVLNAPVNGTTVTITIQYSQVRLTGHDFLYVGSGNFYNTGYATNNFSTANKNATYQTVNSYGGRVFFTATDQDGNFNVGNLFNVAQATGIATLNASLFNLSGLNQLQFASGGANITQFSTDGNMTGNSDALVPTQRAVRAYIASQLGAGGSNITANSLTAGSVFISGTTITTTNSNNLTITATGTQISVTKLAVFTQAQSSYVPTTGADLTNKTYVDGVKSFAFFVGAH